MAAHRFFDDISRLATDAAGVAQGVRREVETAVKGQVERLLRDMDVATREETEVLRDMIAGLRAENERLAARVAALEGAAARSAPHGGEPPMAGAGPLADQP